MTSQVVVACRRVRDSRRVATSTAPMLQPRAVARSRARQLLATVAGVDVVGGVACLALAEPIATWLGLGGATPVVLAGLAQLFLAGTGLAGLRADPDAVAGPLRRQAVLNVGCAALLAAIGVVAEPNGTGVVVLVVAALAVVALAAAQWRLAAHFD